ncbi:MAG TPA: DUF2877 domain-containing protein [Trebonia sp.]|nr:DUF2877 domain-containing protein [Trebonia sp.]
MPGQRSAVTVELAGVASLALRDLLSGPRREGRVVAALRGIVFAEFPGAPAEPRVIALCGPNAPRLPNAFIAIGTIGAAPGNTGKPSAPPGVLPPGTLSPGALTDLIAVAASPRPQRGRVRPPLVYAGGGKLRLGGLTVNARHWWDPSPVVGPLSRARLDRGATALGRLLAEPSTAPAAGSAPPAPALPAPAAGSVPLPRPAMAGHPDVRALAGCCASGDLAGAVEHAEAIVGLGAGIVPAGDGALIGILLALRLLGGAIPGGTRAVWLADWLSAAVTSYARQRTTALAAALLYCASRGQAPAEVAAVLHGIAGEEPLDPAARALLLTTAAGADIAWGLVAGCRAGQVLSVS